MAGNLLHSIQEEAVDADADLASLLRKCRILAQRIGNEGLKQWVAAELDGYPKNGEIPEYRVFNSPILLGHYMGPFGSGLTNVKIPMTAVDERIRDMVVPIRFYQGVAELEALIDHCDDGFLSLAIQPEAFPGIRHRSIADHLVLAEAKKMTSTSVIEGILSTVRNRILNFTLELEEYAPDTGDPLRSLKEEQQSNVSKIFHTQILGAVGNLNQGGNHVSQTATIQKGDLNGVERELLELGVPESDVAEFKEALVTEEPQANGAWGKKLSGIFGRTMQKAAEGALKVSGNVAASVIGEAIKNYYGS